MFLFNDTVNDEVESTGYPNSLSPISIISPLSQESEGMLYLGP